MWLRAESVARAQCSGAVEEWLCRLGRARLLEAGLGTGRGWCEQKRRWLWLWLRPLVATGGGGAGAVKLSKTRAQVGRALKRLGR